MSQFENVTIDKKANVYFGGGVTSRTIHFPNGEVKTLGMMQLGDYEFNTDKKELMEIQQGEVEVLLPGQDEWHRFSAGESFEVAAKASFKIKALSLADYCCSFID
ncbi:Putative cytoplasmic protein [hydrothermal vent metagenome]|uniref:Cytoplasmic protein n=1 Tax=hydrothermal vent metagenome TaxID=652676 RepID=A0A3B0ZES6_9ZZZZ